MNNINETATCTCQCKHIMLQTEQMDQWATAMAKAQAEYDVPAFDDTGHFTSKKHPQGNPFCTLTSLKNATAAALTRHGLSVTSDIISEPEGDFLVTTVWHSSGQWRRGRVLLRPDKPGNQGLAGANTYMVRTCYANSVGAARGEYDYDMGEGIEGTESEPVDTGHTKPEKTISDKAIAYLNGLGEEEVQKILSFNKIDNLKQMTVSQYNRYISSRKA